uniref:CCHC-type domain-containing protein n=1 Tax=Tetradesmus obliquus TaxID=3088 RepID=A0A383VQQ3_TETOB|eukprot:jgi/Sobl393_1/17684/SZX67092.1
MPGHQPAAAVAVPQSPPGGNLNPFAAHTDVTAGFPAHGADNPFTNPAGAQLQQNPTAADIPTAAAAAAGTFPPPPSAAAAADAFPTPPSAAAAADAHHPQPSKATFPGALAPAPAASCASHAQTAAIATAAMLQQMQQYLPNHILADPAFHAALASTANAAAAAAAPAHAPASIQSVPVLQGFPVSTAVAAAAATTPCVLRPPANPNASFFQAGTFCDRRPQRRVRFASPDHYHPYSAADRNNGARRGYSDPGCADGGGPSGVGHTNPIQCYACKGSGHIVRDCPSKGSKPGGKFQVNECGCDGLAVGTRVGGERAAGSDMPAYAHVGDAAPASTAPAANTEDVAGSAAAQVSTSVLPADCIGVAELCDSAVMPPDAAVLPGVVSAAGRVPTTPPACAP